MILQLDGLRVVITHFSIIDKLLSVFTNICLIAFSFLICMNPMDPNTVSLTITAYTLSTVIENLHSVFGL